MADLGRELMLSHHNVLRCSVLGGIDSGIAFENTGDKYLSALVQSLAGDA